MDDDEIRSRIEALVEEERDQLWDLRRQRDAKRQYDEDPESASVRPRSEVEGYLQ